MIIQLIFLQLLKYVFLILGVMVWGNFYCYSIRRQVIVFYVGFLVDCVNYKCSFRGWVSGGFSIDFFLMGCIRFIFIFKDDFIEDDYIKNSS